MGKNIKITILSTALSIVLIGCGSDSSRDYNKNENIDTKLEPTTISGKVVDGYLQGATVCLDLDKNGKCGGIEPIAISNDNGGYTLQISTNIQEQKNYKDAPLIVYGGVDKDSGEGFNGLLQAPKSGNLVNITPISTLVEKAVKGGLSLDDAKSKIALVTSIDQEKLLKDPVDELNRGDSRLIEKSIAIHKAVEAVAIKRSTNDSELRTKVDDVYTLLIGGLKNDASDIDDLLEKSFQDSESDLAKQVSNQVSKAFSDIPASSDKLSKIAISTEKMLKNVKDGENIEDIDFDKMDWNSEYIKKDLAKIGITDASVAMIDKIRIAYKEEDSLKGALLKYPAKLSSVSGLEDVYTKTIQKIYEIEKDKIEKDKAIARNSQNITPITKQSKLYTNFTDRSIIGYTEFDFSGSSLAVNDYLYENLDFVREDFENDAKKNSYIFSDNQWNILNDETKSSIILDGGVAINSFMKEKISLVDEKPFSYTSFLSADFIADTTSDSQAKQYTLKIQKSDDFYILHDRTRYSSISEFISDHCGANNYFSFINDDKIVGGISFSADANAECNPSLKSGRLSEVNRVDTFSESAPIGFTQSVVNNDIGTWKIVTLPDSDIEALVIKPYSPDRYADGKYSFYAPFSSDAKLDHALWSGEFQEKGSVVLLPVINQVAMDFLKNNYINSIKAKMF